MDERPLAALGDGPEGLLRVQFADAAAADYAALFYRSRQRQSSDLARQLGCALDAPMPEVELIRVDTSGQTTVPGVYAACDAVNTTQQAIIAASEGPVAAAAINRALLAEDFA